MKTLKTSRSVLHLTNGNILAHPSESVWGLGVDPLNEAALNKLIALKGRPPKHGFIVIASSWMQLEDWLTPLNEQEKAILNEPTKHPISWIIPIQKKLPKTLTGDRDSLACRVTKHPPLKKLCEHFGPMVSTSANPHGETPAKSSLQISMYFGEQVAILDGPLGSETRPSRIIDLKSSTIIRE